jgi:hypothetical protein
MSIFQSLLDAYTAPEMAAQQAPQNTASAWGQIMDSMNPKPQTGPQMSPVQQLGISMPAPQKIGPKGFEGSLPQRTNQQPQQPASPLDRWKMQIDKMMRSGDPALQKQAMTMMGSYYDKATAQQDPKVSAYGQQAMDMGLQPGTKPFRDMVERLATQARVTIMRNEGERSGYLTKEEKEFGGLDVDSPFVWGKDGIPRPLKTSGYTEGNILSAGFAERMHNVEQELEALDLEGFTPGSLQQKAGELIPFVGGKLMTEQQQVAARAQLDWIKAKLRKESGAAISQEEIDTENQTYFPQPGDLPSVIEAKKYAREVATRAMADGSGGKYKIPTKKDIKKIAKEIEADLPPLPEGLEFYPEENN